MPQRKSNKYLLAPRPILRFWVIVFLLFGIAITPDIIEALDAIEFIDFSDIQLNIVETIKWYLLIPSISLSLIWWTRSYIRFYRKVIKYDYKICLYCGYILVGLPDISNCPECGRTYHVEYLRKVWPKWLGAPWRWRSGDDSRIRNEDVDS